MREPAPIAPGLRELTAAAGWTDEAIYFAITVCARFNFYNRWIDATGVHPMSQEAHRENAHSTGPATCASSGGPYT